VDPLVINPKRMTGSRVIAGGVHAHATGVRSWIGEETP
jgi:hypothetical protein